MTKALKAKMNHGDEGTDNSQSAIRQILVGGFTFPPSLPVSKLSLFGDNAWDWSDPLNPRLSIYASSDLRIDWRYLQSKHDLTEGIIADLKRFVFLRCFHSPHVFPDTHKNSHPISLIHEIKPLLNFLSHLRQMISSDGVSLINKLSDIEARDLENGFSTYTRRSHEPLKKCLKLLASPILGQLLDGRPKWNSADIDNLEWQIDPKQPYERLPEGMFRCLSNAATADVKQFLWAIGVETHDTTRIGEGENIYLSRIDNFKDFFEAYIATRAEWRRSPGSRGYSRYCEWKKSQTHNVGSLLELIDRGRMAAQTLVVEYTGARRSELVTLRHGCLRRERGQWFIYGTLIKHEDVNAPANQDRWIAIPIVRDALRVLEETGRLVDSEFVFHGMRPVTSDRLMSSADLAGRLTAYLEIADRDGEWGGQHIHAHMFRESLAFEMRKVGLGLPCITFQLKHLFSTFNHRANNTTLGYGGVGMDACRLAIKAANKEALREIFHPDAPVAGGGAEQLKKRRAAYFQGMALRGFDAEQVLQLLGNQGGMPLTDVGLGYCQGKKKVVTDGVKTDPPCIGSLRCNPVRCKNGIIPAHKAVGWKKLRDENRRRAEDPAFTHARSYLLEAAEEADAVVAFLERRRQQN